MSSGVSFASLIAARITRYAPSPFSAGWVMWYASPDIPYPTISARIGALRFRACSSDSRIRIPAPSPTTKPSRPASHGRLALAGSSLRVESAFIAAKPPTPIGVIVASVPPPIIISAAPRSIILNESPMACADAAHAVTNRNMSRGQIHNRGRNKERRNPAGAALYQFDVLALDDIEPADAR